MDLLEKPDALVPAFEITSGAVKFAAGVQLDDEDLPETVALPDLTPGTDYMIARAADGGQFEVRPFAFGAEPLGGFHVFLDGAPAQHSAWDRNFRPRHFDPRGMVLWNGISWIDIYKLNTQPWKYGTSRANVPIATGANPPEYAEGCAAEDLNFWTAEKILAMNNKQLLSVPEFFGAMAGVEEGKNCGTRPELTGHVPGLRSAIGVEQATGCIWDWLRDQTSWGGVRLAGGYWNSSRAGARQLDDNYARSSGSNVGARGRCDHLILV